MVSSDLIENWAKTWIIRTRRYGLAIVITGLAALACLVNSYRVDDRERAAQQDAEARGVVVPAVVEVVDVNSGQDRIRVRVAVQGIQRIATVFTGDLRLVGGTSVQVAWTPADPSRIYIVGARPWNWWVAMRPLFATIAVVSLLLILAGVLSDFRHQNA